MIGLLKEFSADNFRNLAGVEFLPGPGFNLIIGKNAQGKSNLLESIYSLSLGRSYRTNREEEVISFGWDFTRVFGCFSGKSGDYSLEIAWDKTSGNEFSKSIRYNSNPVHRLADFIDKAPMVMLVPDDLDLIRGVPDDRRKFLDLLCSRLSPSYVGLLRDYKKILETRNRWLKLPQNEKDKHLGEIYDEKLAETGSGIIFRRLLALEILRPILSDLFKDIFGAEMPDLRYISSIREIKDKDFEGIRKAFVETLKKSAYIESIRHFTFAGPHRDDFDLKRDGRSMKSFSSMGEIRSVAVILKLAELEAIAGKTDKTPIILIDDSLNEFDPEKIRQFLDYLSGGRQIFYATTEISPYFNHLENLAVFEVMEGSVNRATGLS